MLPNSRPNASQFTLPPKPKRKIITVACNACRMRKSKCDAGRPTCGPCRARGTDCEYVTIRKETPIQVLKRKFSELESQKTANEDIIELLQSSREEEAYEILRRIRAGADIETLLRHIRDGDLLLQLSLVPESRFRYEFPYIKDMPSFLLRPDNPYLGSLVYEWTLGDSAIIQQQAKPMDAGKDEYESPYLKPCHAAEIVDPQLGSVKPSAWTSVSSDNELMRKLLCSYFLYEYQWLAIFNKDLFLEDMVARRHRFCSPLLVNALLAFACLCYRGIPNRNEHWNPHNLGYQFLAEAKRLWELEVGKSRLTSIQAAVLLNLTCGMNGADKIGWLYTLQAVAMADNLRLFKVSTEIKSKKMCNARDFTAWSLFFWQSLHCYATFIPPLLEKPPESPLPDPATNPQWYGDIWMKYPLNQTIFPAHHGHLFKAKAELWSITNDIALQAFKYSGSRQRLSIEQILGFYSRLTAWYNNLPEPLTPKRIVLPDQFKLHMHYYNTQINLFESLAVTELENLEHSTFAQRMEKMPQEVVSDARNRLETLLRLYYLRHSFDTLDFFLTHYLGLLGFISLNDIKMNVDSPNINDKRSLLILCAKGLHDQGQYVYIAQIVFCLVQDGMRQEEANLLKQFVHVEEIEENQLLRLQQIRSQYPVNIVSIDDNAENQRVSNLIKDYMDLSLESASESSPGSEN